MTNYQEYQLNWMLANNISLQDLIKELDNIYWDKAKRNPIILFARWESYRRDNNLLWLREKEWEECEEGKEMEEKRTRNYMYNICFYATFPFMKNGNFTKDYLKEFAKRKLQYISAEFTNVELRDIKYNFDSEVHFEAEVRGYTSIFFSVEPDEDFIEVFREAIENFEANDKGGFKDFHVLFSGGYMPESMEEFSKEDLFEINEYGKEVK